MREILEDALKNKDAGLGRAGRPEPRQLARRFYKNAAVAMVGALYAIHLDGRPVKTPAMVTLLVPNPALAEVLAGEWQSQTELIDPVTMPATRLVNSALSVGETQLGLLRDEIMKFAGNDLLLYRATDPQSLVEAENAAWDPVLTALARNYGVKFQPTTAIMHQPQPTATLLKLAEPLATLGNFSLTSLLSMTTLMGSGLLAIAVNDHLIDGENAWAAAHVDELFNQDHWGEDFEAARRMAYRKAEFAAALAVLERAKPA